MTASKVHTLHARGSKITFKSADVCNCPAIKRWRSAGECCTFKESCVSNCTQIQVYLQARQQQQRPAVPPAQMTEYGLSMSSESLCSELVHLQVMGLVRDCRWRALGLLEWVLGLLELVLGLLDPVLGLLDPVLRLTLPALGLHLT